MSDWPPQGLEYGAGFRGLKQLWRDGDEALGVVELPEALRREAGSYHLHPACWDACLHVLGGDEAAEGDSVYVPVCVAAVDVWRRPAGTTVYSHATRHVDPDGVSADVTLYDPDGTPLARLTGLRLQRVLRETFIAVQHMAATVTAADTARSTVRFDSTALKRLSPDEQRDRIVAFLQQQAAAVLRSGSPGELDPKKSFFEMGMDSLMGVEFLYRINRQMQTSLSAQRLMEKPYLGRLAEVLLAQLRETGEASAAATETNDIATDELADEPENAWFPYRRSRLPARRRCSALPARKPTRGCLPIGPRSACRHRRVSRRIAGNGPPQR